MIKYLCDDCQKPLEQPPMIMVREIVFIKPEGPQAMQNLHFCDQKCLTSSIVKAVNKPSLIVPAQ